MFTSDQVHFQSQAVWQQHILFVTARPEFKYWNYGEEDVSRQSIGTSALACEMLMIQSVGGVQN